MACTLQADNAFGPTVGHGCREDFDFTLLFEQYFFQIAPCAFLLLLVPLRASQLRTRSVKVSRNGVQTIKQLAILVLAATQLSLLILWSLTPMYRTAASIPAAALSFLASVSLLYLSSMEHSRSIRPSSLINVYIFAAVLFDIPQARTLWLRPGPRALPALFTAGMAAKVVVLCLESQSKRRWLYPAYHNLAPEALVNLYDRISLWWINPLFWKGYSSLLNVDALSSIDRGLKAGTVENLFSKFWNRRNKSRSWAMHWAVFCTVRWSFLAMIVPKLCNSALKLSQALFINQMTTILGLTTDAQNQNIAWGLTLAAVLIYTGMAVTHALYQRQVHRMTTQIRAIVITSVYTKTLRLPSEKLADSAALTLISADVDRITASMTLIMETFTAPLEVGVAIFLLERQIGIACIAPATFIIFISLVSFVSSNFAVDVQKRWLMAVSVRVAYTGAVLNNPKGFKMLGLTDYFTRIIQGLRVSELAQYAAFRKYVTWRNVFSNLSTTFAPPLCLTVFVLVEGGHALDPTTAFTALALVALMTDPIQEVIHAVPMLQTVSASLDRIQDFLLIEEPAGLISPTHRASGLSEERASSSLGGAIELVHIKPQKIPKSDLVLSMKGCSVTLGKDEKCILRDLSFDISAKSLVLVVGPVGSGKSTLLKTVVGDIPLSNGIRELSSYVEGFAFCAQDPWLPNATVKKLICSETKFDQDWYTNVINACSLVADISTFRDGEDTLIGTRGVSLSGGQRQRLALARAIYARKKILVVDDVLSGLDSSTSKQVFARVFGPSGICKAQGMTVIFATHARKYLSASDYIIAIGADGSVREQGTFPQLNVEGSYVNELEYNHETSSEHEAAADADTEPMVKLALSAGKDADALADHSRRTGDIKVYSYYMRSIGWKLVTTFFVFATGGAAGLVVPSIWVRLWSAAETSGDSSASLGYWVGVYFGIAAAGAVSQFCEVWTMLIYTVPKSSANLHKRILDTTMRASYLFFTKTDSGTILNRFSSDMSLIDGVLAGSVLQFAGGVILIIGSAALIASGANYAAATLPFILLVLYVIQRVYLRTSRQLRNLELEAQASLITHCSETLAGVTTIRAFGWQHQAHEKLQDLLDASQRPFYLLLCVQRWLGFVLALVTAGFAVVVIAMATNLRSISSAAAVGLSLLNVLGFTANLTYVINAWTSLETSLGAVARCRTFEMTTPTEDQAHEQHVPALDWPQRGTLEISNLVASYNNDDKAVLKSISFSVAAGQKIGICGRSGSGKSSLLLALFRLLNASSGKIIVDGIDVSTIPRQTVRERFCALPQETISFPGTLHANLDPLNTSGEEEAIVALQKTGLYDLVLPRGGLQADMTSLGLSQGQMQLFAVARALLRRSKILVLDEMSSSVDVRSEETMLRLIRENFADSTVIAVAHRLKTIVDFDKIVVMDGGHIVEAGTADELFALPNGKFKALWEQSGER